MSLSTADVNFQELNADIKIHHNVIMNCGCNNFRMTRECSEQKQNKKMKLDCTVQICLMFIISLIFFQFSLNKFQDFRRNPACRVAVGTVLFISAARTVYPAAELTAQIFP